MALKPPAAMNIHPHRAGVAATSQGRKATLAPKVSAWLVTNLNQKSSELPLSALFHFGRTFWSF